MVFKDVYDAYVSFNDLFKSKAIRFQWKSTRSTKIRSEKKPACLRLLTRVGFFSKTGSDTVRSVRCMERSKNLEKRFYNSSKIFTFQRRFGCKNTFFLDIEKANSRSLFSSEAKCKTITRG